MGQSMGQHMGQNTGQNIGQHVELNTNQNTGQNSGNNIQQNFQQSIPRNNGFNSNPPHDQTFDESASQSPQRNRQHSEQMYNQEIQQINHQNQQFQQHQFQQKNELQQNPPQFHQDQQFHQNQQNQLIPQTSSIDPNSNFTQSSPQQQISTQLQQQNLQLQQNHLQNQQRMNQNQQNQNNFQQNNPVQQHAFQLPQPVETQNPPVERNGTPYENEPKNTQQHPIFQNPAQNQPNSQNLAIPQNFKLIFKQPQHQDPHFEQVENPTSFAKPAPAVQERIPIEIDTDTPENDEMPNYENVLIRPRPKAQEMSPPQRPPKTGTKSSSNLISTLKQPSIQPSITQKHAPQVQQLRLKQEREQERELKDYRETRKSKTELTSQWVDECSQNVEIKESVSNYQIEQEKLVSDLKLTLKYELKKSKIEKQRSEIELQRYRLEYEQMKQRTSGQNKEIDQLRTKLREAGVVGFTPLEEPLQQFKELEDSGIKSQSQFTSQRAITPISINYKRAVFKSEIIKCVAEYTYKARGSDEMSFNKNDIINIRTKDTGEAGWWEGTLENNQEVSGIFPSNFVRELKKSESEYKKSEVDQMGAGASHSNHATSKNVSKHATKKNANVAAPVTRAESPALSSLPEATDEENLTGSVKSLMIPSHAVKSSESSPTKSVYAAGL